MNVKINEEENLVIDEEEKTLFKKKISKEALEWEISFLKRFKEQAIEALEEIESLESSKRIFVEEHFDSISDDIFKVYRKLKHYVGRDLGESKGKGPYVDGFLKKGRERVEYLKSIKFEDFY